MKTKVCETCQSRKPVSNFTKYSNDSYRPHCQQCLWEKAKSKITPEKTARRRANLKAWYAANPHIRRIKAYRFDDQKKGRKTISITKARKLIENGICFYCKEDDVTTLGLDRINNKLGHSARNVVVCCATCNYLLVDLPFSAKLLMKSALRKIKIKELLEKWIVPTKRRK